MADGSLSIKRSITVRAVVTPRWKEDAERELSAAIATSDAQLVQLEQEGQQVVDEIRRQSANPLDPRVQDQMEQIVEQGQLESFTDIQVGDNLVEKLQVTIVVRDGVVEAIEAA